MIPDKRIQELKDLIEKKEGKEISWEEASKAAHNLEGLVRLLFDHAVEDERRKKKLEEFPKGYSLEGNFSCALCGASTHLNGNWYDKHGIKCLICQDSINRKEIPVSIVTNKDSWYSKYDLESCFNIKGSPLTAWIKKGVIKPRHITHNGKVYDTLFLIKDNKELLPPKKLVKSRLVSIKRDGQTWHRSEPWYKFVDPHKHLAKYKIMDYLTVVENDV